MLGLDMAFLGHQLPGTGAQQVRNLDMKNLLAAALAIACVVGSTPVFAAPHGTTSGVGRGFHSGLRGMGPRDRGIMAPPPDTLQSRIPAPLPSPGQPPVINGPMTPNPMLPSMGNGMR